MIGETDDGGPVDEPLPEPPPLPSVRGPKGLFGRGKVTGVMSGGSRARREAVARETAIPERFLREACATVFPNGERFYGDDRVVALARELMGRAAGE